MHNYKVWFEKYIIPGGGGTDLERGYGGCAALKTQAFHASPVVRKGPHFKQKSQFKFTRPPFEKF